MVERYEVNLEADTMLLQLLIYNEVGRNKMLRCHCLLNILTESRSLDKLDL